MSESVMLDGPRCESQAQSATDDQRFRTWNCGRRLNDSKYSGTPDEGVFRNIPRAFETCTSPCRPRASRSRR